VKFDAALANRLGRRRLLKAGGGFALGGIASGLIAEGRDEVRLPLNGGPLSRPLSSAFPGKGGMIVQRTRPPLLETPLSAFREAFTPNDQFFVRWHWADFPTAIDADRFRLRVGGHVRRPLTLSLSDLLALPGIEYAAVNQCSGNSRGFFDPRVPGAQWGHGAMGNALWRGVPLKSVLDRAGVRGWAVSVRFSALDEPGMEGAPKFLKSLAIDHARDGEVMVAFAMNGEQLPLLNGFPLRLIVPGWYSTYWVKALSGIEVLNMPDDNYWMAKAYRIPVTPHASVIPGSKDYPTEPISRMVPRSWITSLPENQVVAYEPAILLGGIAMGGDCGVARVQLSADEGRTWHDARLLEDHGPFSFRVFEGRVPISRPGRVALLSRCTNNRGETQPLAANWNPGGFMRGCVETTHIELRHGL